MTTTQQVIDGYLERMECPTTTRDEFDDLVERVRALKALDLES
jgi:hypothetical protein